MKVKLKCKSCGAENDAVRVRDCGYSLEINGTREEETICDSCEQSHLDDI